MGYSFRFAGCGKRVEKRRDEKPTSKSTVRRAVWQRPKKNQPG
jgi:hypothetical protein